MMQYELNYIIFLIIYSVNFNIHNYVASTKGSTLATLNSHYF